jgi:hypothetical protein
VILDLDGTLRTRSEPGADGEVASITSLFKNGKPREESHWAKGAPDGLWIQWDESGRVVRRAAFGCRAQPRVEACSKRLSEGLWGEGAGVAGAAPNGHLQRRFRAGKFARLELGIVF